MQCRLIAVAEAAPDSNVASDTGAEELLNALVAFLQPVIQGYTASPGRNVTNGVFQGSDVAFCSLASAKASQSREVSQ